MQNKRRNARNMYRGPGSGTSICRLPVGLYALTAGQERYKERCHITPARKACFPRRLTIAEHLDSETTNLSALPFWNISAPLSSAAHSGWQLHLCSAYLICVGTSFGSQPPTS